jgi:hypothetical protein
MASWINSQVNQTTYSKDQEEENNGSASTGKAINSTRIALTGIKTEVESIEAKNYCYKTNKVITDISKIGGGVTRKLE